MPSVSPATKSAADNSQSSPLRQLNSTSVTSPLRRIPSFIDDEEEEEEGAKMEMEMEAEAAKTKPRLKKPPVSDEEEFFDVLGAPIGENDAGGNTQLNSTTKQPKRTISVTKLNTRKRANVDYEDAARGHEENTADVISSSNLNSAAIHRQLTQLRSPNCSWNFKLVLMRRILQAIQACSVETQDCFSESPQNQIVKDWWRELCLMGEVCLENSETCGALGDILDRCLNWDCRNKGNGHHCEGQLHLLLLRAKVLTVQERPEEALKLIEEAGGDLLKSQFQAPSELQGELFLLKGRLCRSLGNRQRAILAFKRVLELFEADSCSAPSSSTSMSSMSKHFDAHEQLYGPTCGLLPLKFLASEDPARRALIEAFHYRGDYSEVVDGALRGIWTDWLGDGTVLIHLISSLAMKYDSAALYGLAQRCVDQRPQDPTTWYGVGLFYQISGRVEEARRYFFKATTMCSSRLNSGASDVASGPAWTALGHSFAAYGDHDQAIAAYIAAARIHSPGNPEPTLSLAIEYLRVRQSVLATAYLVSNAGNDSSEPGSGCGNARMFNEIACLQAEKGNFPMAKKLLGKALELKRDDAVSSETAMILAVNWVVVRLKEQAKLLLGSWQRSELKSLLKELSKDHLKPHVSFAEKILTSPCDQSRLLTPTWSLFPWHQNCSNVSPALQVIWLHAQVLEWQALLDDQGIREKLLLESLKAYEVVLTASENGVKQYANGMVEEAVIDRRRRVLQALSLLATSHEKAEKAACDLGNGCNLRNTPMARTPLIKSFSAANISSSSAASASSSNLIMTQTPTLRAGFMASTLLASASSSNSTGSLTSLNHRRLSLRRQMTGLRFDPPIMSGSSDVSFVSISDFPEENNSSFLMDRSSRLLLSEADLSGISSVDQLHEDLMYVDGNGNDATGVILESTIESEEMDLVLDED